MKYLDQTAVELLNDRLIFEQIHELKSFFVSLFSELANEIPSSYLSSIHETSLGTKISKGNELERCPYQVLDIVRDFDKDKGFNIRLLNWWGRGLYIFVFMGKNNKNLLKSNDFISAMQFHGYLVAKTSSPWDYKKMIDGGNLEPIDPLHQLQLHLDRYHYLQLTKKIIYSEEYDYLKKALKEQVEHILFFYEG